MPRHPPARIKQNPPIDNERPPSILKILINPANPDSDNARNCSQFPQSPQITVQTTAHLIALSGQPIPLLSD